MFATRGTPRQLESDNGLPFNSREFAEFAKTERFHHHRVTPEHARANGEAESFMKLLNNKTAQITHLKSGNSSTAIQEMLTGYRSTPHPATGIAAYEALMNRQVRTKLDHQTRESSENARDTAINDRDERYKEKLKQNAENRSTKAHNFIVGDHVLLKQQKRNKWSTAYEPAFYTVIRTDQALQHIESQMDGKCIETQASSLNNKLLLLLFKTANALIQDNNSEERDDWEEDPTTEDWREKILLNANPQSVQEEITANTK